MVNKRLSHLNACTANSVVRVHAFPRKSLTKKVDNMANEELKKIEEMLIKWAGENPKRAVILLSIDVRWTI